MSRHRFVGLLTLFSGTTQFAMEGHVVGNIDDHEVKKLNNFFNVDVKKKLSPQKSNKSHRFK